MSHNYSHLHRSSRMYLRLLLLIALGSPAAAQVCTHPESFYSTGNFKVRQVRLESPLDFMRAMSSHLNALKPRLPLQPGSVFTLEKSSEGRLMIENALDDLEEEADPRSRVRVVLAGIDNCEESAAQPVLDVYYRVFTTNYNSYLSHTYEIKQQEIERSAAAAATTAARTQTKGFLLVRPFVTYNRTKRLFGGARMGLRIPGEIFDTVEVSAGGSTAGHGVALEVEGSRAMGLNALDHLEYRISFEHSDVAAGTNRLRQGLLRTQIFGSSRPLGSAGIVLRYGASLEGGNLQTDLPVAVGANSRANSGYGGLKSYIGATMRTKDVSMTASYGLQLGTRGATTDLDFVKHIGDLALSARWLIGSKPGEFHRALTVETQLTAGAINTIGTVPVAQRFFGGNVAHEFIEGDTWRIRSGPFIRSFAENRLSSDTLGDIGGTGFYSANLTFALPIWGRPLIPAVMAKDPTFPELLAGQKESARKQLVFRYLNDIPAFSGMIADLKAIDDEVKELEPFLEEECVEPEDEEDDPRSELEKSRCKVRDLIRKIHSRMRDKENLPGRLDAMLRARDDEPTCVEDDTCSELKRLRIELETWERLLPAASSAQVIAIAARVRNSLATRQPGLVTAYNTIDASPEKKEAERLGTEDMKQLEPVLDSFINELNWFAVGPVGIFDAARVWPDRHGTRFGLGGGVRISVVNFNVTVGYAFNPRRKANEDRGAIFFSMDVTDLFR